MTVRYGRRLMLKGLPEGSFDDSPEMLRLQKEFDLSIRIDHRNIVKTLDFKRFDDAGTCVVMEWIDGQTLSEWLRQVPSSHDRMRVARELTDAVVYLHSIGICHRDLKPDNIMITHAGSECKLIDFGHADSHDQTILKKSCGTVSYGAPEQQTQNGSESGKEADIYSLAKILISLNPSFANNRVIKRCFAKDAQCRPSAADVREAIKSSKTKKKIIIVAVAAVAVVLTLASVWLMVRYRNVDIPDERASSLMLPEESDIIEPSVEDVSVETDSPKVSDSVHSKSEHTDNADDSEPVDRLEKRNRIYAHTKQQFEDAKLRVLSIRKQVDDIKDLSDPRLSQLTSEYEAALKDLMDIITGYSDQMQELGLPYDMWYDDQHPMFMISYDEWLNSESDKK